ncbi:MAG: hypothetical protein WKF30_13335 [Pyrinomonadaceae bacterium]
MLHLLATLLFCLLPVSVAAQEAVASAPQPTEPMLALPPSDMVMTIDVRRIMDEAVPRILVNAPLARARFNAELEKVRAKSGFDLRSIDRIVVGMGDFNVNLGNTTAAAAPEGATPNKAQNNMPGKFVAIVTGSFNAPVLVAAARLVSGGKYKEERYAQSTLYTFVIDKAAAPEAFSAVPAPEISLTSLDAHTIVIGFPGSVRAAIDLHSGQGLSAANADLISMANNTRGALVGVGAAGGAVTKRQASAAPPAKKLELTPLDNLGSTDAANASGTGSGTENEITKALAAVRQVFFSVGMADTHFNVRVVARTEQSSQAQELVSMLEALRGFAESAKDPKVRKMLDVVKVFSENNELLVNAEFAQADVASLVTDKDLKMTAARPAAASRSAKRTAVRRRRRG